MQNQPFDKPGRFFKGNIHTHSTNSDGRLTPEQVISEYQQRGYDFISLTDHFLPRKYFVQRHGADAVGFIGVTDTTAFRNESFTTLLGAEIHGPSLANGEKWHMVAVGLPVDFAHWDGQESGPVITARAAATGAFIGIAHPAWYSLTIEDVKAALPFSHAVEIYNHACGLPDRANSWHFAEVLLAEGHRLTAIATDDAHFSERAVDGDAFGGWVHVKSESLDPDALLAALKAGSFYSSTGPEIRDIRRDGNELVVQTSPVARIFVTGTGAKSAYEIKPGLTEARFPIADWMESGYSRVTAIDENKKAAWSNPIYFS